MKFRNILLLVIVVGLLTIASVSATSDDDLTQFNEADNLNLNLEKVSLSNSISLNSNNISINPDNYDSYIDSNGKLLSTVNDGDNLIFTGEFINKGEIILSKEVSIYGENAKFTDTTFVFLARNSLITNVNIVNTKGYGIFVKDTSNVTILKNNIKIYDENNAYGIFILNSSNILVQDNIVESSGDDLTYTILGYKCDNSKFISNTVKTSGTGIIHPYEVGHTIYENYTIEECYKTYGMLFAFSSDNYFYNNDITVKSKINEVASTSTSSNTLIGFDLYFGCHNNVIDKNKVIVSGKDLYCYGMGVIGASWTDFSTTSENNRFINNNIKIDGSYYVCGLIAGNQAINTLFKNNTLVLNATNMTYGITLEMSQSSIVLENNVTEEALANYVVELYSSSNNLIDKNSFLVENSHSSTIFTLFYSNDNIITNNPYVIYSTGEEVIDHNEDHPDVVPIENTLYNLVDSNNNVLENNVGSFKNATKPIEKNSENNQIENNDYNQPYPSRTTAATVASSQSSEDSKSNDNGKSNVGDSPSASEGKAYSIDDAINYIISNPYNIAAIVAIVVIILFGYGFFRLRDDEKE